MIGTWSQFLVQTSQDGLWLSFATWLMQHPKSDKHQWYNNFSRFVYAGVMGIHVCFLFFFFHV